VGATRDRDTLQKWKEVGFEGHNPLIYEFKAAYDSTDVTEGVQTSLRRSLTL
jgi:hypothetical protein